MDHAPIAALFARPGLDAPVRAIALAQVATARGDWHALLAVVRATRAHGCARAVLEEGFLQGVLFYGFPRTITAFEVLQREWPTADPPSGGNLPTTSQPPAGRALFRAIYDRNADAVEAMLLSYHGELRDFVLDVAYGRILTRPALAARERELIAVAVLAAMDQTPQLVAHARGALRFGASETAVREALWSALAPDEAAVDAAMAKIVRTPRGG